MEIEFLGKEYPEIKIDFQIIEGKFSPTLIKELSIKWNIPVNFMFIGSPSNKFPYKIEELGGVRLIIWCYYFDAFRIVSQLRICNVSVTASGAILYVGKLFVLVASRRSGEAQGR